MLSIGIDVSKGKSTVCGMKPGGEIVYAPFEVQHTREGMLELVSLLRSSCEEVRAVLESTGSYELLVMADKLEEVKTICWCGKKAMFNARFDENGKVLKEGAQVVLGANDKYIGLCRRHWRAGDLGPDFNGKGTGD